MKKIKLVFLIICAAFTLSACADEIPEPLVSAAPSEPVETDLPPTQEPYPVSFDNETFEASPSTVASLSPSVTEMLFDLGLGDKLVAVSDYCDYPSSLDTLPDAGSPASPDIDVLCEISPELLITLSPIAATDTLRLREEGIRVLQLTSPASFGQLCDLYFKLSLIFYGALDGPAKARDAYSQIDAVLEEIRGSRSPETTIVVVEDYAPDGLMLSPQNSLSSDILSSFGQNIWVEDKYNATEAELFEIGPDIVFYSDKMKESDIRATFPYAKLITVDFERIERPSLRLVEELKRISG